MNAYNELYLDDAMANLGDMVEYAVCTLGYAPDDFFGWFISSGIASKFENGNPKYVAGMSGVELADAVLAAVNMQSERHHQPHLSSKGRVLGWMDPCLLPVGNKPTLQRYGRIRIDTIGSDVSIYPARSGCKQIRGECR